MNEEQKKEVEERLFDKLKEFIVCKMEDVDTTHDAPHFCDGEIDCLKDCYKWKIILGEIHSEIEMAEHNKELEIMAKQFHDNVALKWKLEGARELAERIVSDNHLNYVSDMKECIDKIIGEMEKEQEGK